MPKATEKRTRQWIADRVEMDPFGGCHLWAGAQTPHGYGKTRAGGKNDPQIGAHVLSWIVHNGFIPKGMSVLHNCDVRACVNPHHLRLGTQKENMRDRKVRGRSSCNCGSDNARAKLSESQVREIYGLKGKVHAEDLCERYGVSAAAIRHIWAGRSWKGTVQ